MLLPDLASGETSRPFCLRQAGYFFGEAKKEINISRFPPNKVHSEPDKVGMTNV
jgi:hypothetical protein